MNSFSNVVPPGFRFHPTDEELVDYYLRKRVASKVIDLDVIKDVDLYRIEPWDLDELCKIGSEDQSDYYFFSHKDKKYPTGTRTNRATKAGFWKATGRDKAIYAKQSLVGMRKTLVFYKGRAPNGQKLDWIMHEYRLETNENAPSQEEGWVVCRVFKKKMVATTNMRMMGDHHHHRQESPYWYDEHASFMTDMDSPMRILSSNPNALHNHPYHPSNYSCKQEQQLAGGHHYNLSQDVSSFLDLPQLQSPEIPISASANNPNSYGFGGGQILQPNYQLSISNNTYSFNNEQHEARTDWRVLDKFVASQLSHEEEDAGEKLNYLSSSGAEFDADQEAGMSVLFANNNVSKTVASSSTSGGQVDNQWK